MDIAIWGCGELGKCVYQLSLKFNNHVTAFIDSNTSLENTDIEGIPVFSFKQMDEIFKKEKTTVLLALRNACSIITILRILDNHNIKNVGIVKPRVLAMKSSAITDLNNEIVWLRKKGKKYNVIPRLELNIVDGCNLNCKGCSHFSNLFPKDSVYPISEYEKDLKQIAKIGELVRLRLLGGEPFLAKNIIKYLSIARKIFSTSDIELVTNGLLIPSIENKVLEEIKNNDISLTISKYPPTLKIKEEIQKTLDKADINWRFDNYEISSFGKNLTLEKTHDKNITSINCISNGCIFLRQGKLYKCPLEGLVYKLETSYHIKFDIEERGINIYTQQEKLYEELINLIMNPIEMCQYCSEKMEFFNWEIKNIPDLQDWLCVTNFIN